MKPQSFGRQPLAAAALLGVVLVPLFTSRGKNNSTSVGLVEVYNVP